MIISGFSFVVMHSAAKYLSEQIHIFEITFLRCALVIVVLAPIIFKGRKSIFITKQPKFQIYRIITNSIAMLCFFYGLTLTSLAEVTALNLTVPIFTTLLAFVFLKEKSTILARSIGTRGKSAPDVLSYFNKKVQNRVQFR